MSIRSFGSGLTEKIFLGVKDKDVSKFPRDILKIAVRKLDMIESAAAIQDLASPPANRLEKLKGELREYWSIRINDQWRVIFKWLDDGPYEVEIVDYH